jgi:hypothetical protein
VCIRKASDVQVEGARLWLKRPPAYPMWIFLNPCMIGVKREKKKNVNPQECGGKGIRRDVRKGVGRARQRSLGRQKIKQISEAGRGNRTRRQGPRSQSHLAIQPNSDPGHRCLKIAGSQSNFFLKAKLPRRSTIQKCPPDKKKSNF